MWRATEAGKWRATEAGKWRATEAGKWHGTEASKWHGTEAGKWHAAKLPLVGNGKLASSLKPRLSMPDFVTQLWSCETKSGTESLGSRQLTSTCLARVYLLAWGWNGNLN